MRGGLIGFTIILQLISSRLATAALAGATLFARAPGAGLASPVTPDFCIPLPNHQGYTLTSTNDLPRLAQDLEKVPSVIRKLVTAGQLGIKSGRGICQYTPESAAAARALRDRKFAALARLLYP